MKHLSSILFLFFTLSALAQTTTSQTRYRGQDDTAYQNGKLNVQLPSSQVDAIDATTVLLSTGNDNLLRNAGGESSVASSGWTIVNTGTGVTGSITNQASTIALFGKKNTVLNCNTTGAATGSCRFRNEALTGAAIQGLVSIFARQSLYNNTFFTVKICAVIDGVTSTQFCKSDLPLNSFVSGYVHPFTQASWPVTLGATSTGVEVLITNIATISGGMAVETDAAFTGKADLRGSVEGARFFASKRFAVGCGDSLLATATFTNGFSFSGSCTPTISGQTSDTTNNPHISLKSYPAGRYVVFAKGIFYSAAGNQQLQVRATDGTNFSNQISIFSSGAATSESIYVGEWVTSTPQPSAQINIQMATVPAGATSGIYTSGISAGYEISVYYYPSTTTGLYQSTNADTDWAACNITPSGATFASQELQCKRTGGNLDIKGKATFTSGVASELRFGLPLWGGSQLISKGTAVIPSLQKAGDADISFSSSTTFGEISVLIEPSVAYVTFASKTSTNNGLTKVNGSGTVGSGTILTLKASIPIEGWENSNVIIGQFNGLETCKDSYECADSFSVRLDTGGQPIAGTQTLPWISSCTYSAGAGTCTYVADKLKGGGQALSSAMNCVSTDTSGATGATATRIYDTGNTYFSYSMGAGRTMSITCFKAPADYLGKTAKAVASDQNVRSIGSIGVDIQSVYFGSGADCASLCTTGTCNICNKVGGKITSVTWQGSGVYHLNGIDGFKYNCHGTGYSGSYLSGVHARGSSAITYARMDFAATNTGYNSVDCVGTP